MHTQRHNMHASHRAQMKICGAEPNWGSSWIYRVGVRVVCTLLILLASSPLLATGQLVTATTFEDAIPGGIPLARLDTTKTLPDEVWCANIVPSDLTIHSQLMLLKQCCRVRLIGFTRESDAEIVFNNAEDMEWCELDSCPLDMSKLPSLPRLTKLRVLRLNNVQLRGGACPQGLDKFPSLQVLQLVVADVPVLDLTAVSTIASLKEIHLQIISVGTVEPLKSQLRCGPMRFERIALYGVPDTVAKALIALCAPDTITALRFRNCVGVRDILQASVGVLKYLLELDVSACVDADPTILDVVMKLTNIQILSIGNCFCGRDIDITGIAGLPNLASLTFSSKPKCAPRSISFAAESVGGDNDAQLQILDLSGNSVIPESFVKWALRSPVLRECDFRGLEGISAAVPELLAKHSGLTVLRISAMSISRAHLEDVVKANTGLQILEMRKLACSNDLMRSLAQCKGLRRLDVSYCTGAFDEGLSALLCHSTNLQWLSLAGCKQLTSEHCEYLSRLASLYWLNISGSKISDEAAKMLSASTTLVELNASECQDLRDEDLLLLGKIPHLRAIFVRGTGVTKAGVSAFRIKYPQVELLNN